MKFKEYVSQLKKFLKNNPEAADYDVVYVSDSEGNSFHLVHYEPTIGYHEGNEFDDDSQPNAVCIN